MIRIVGILFRLLSILSNLLPIVFFLLYKKRNEKKKLWVIFIYCCISLLSDSSYKILRNGSTNSLFELFSFFTFIEYSSFSLFFYLTYKTPAFKKILVCCSPLFFIILIYNIVFNKGEDFDSLSASAEAAFAVIFSVLYFYEEINDPNVTFIYASKSFWIVIGFLLYLSTNLFPFIARAYISLADTDKGLKFSIALINSVGNILKNVLFTIAFRMVIPPTVSKELNPRKSF